MTPTEALTRARAEIEWVDLDYALTEPHWQRESELFLSALRDLGYVLVERETLAGFRDAAERTVTRSGWLPEQITEERLAELREPKPMSDLEDTLAFQIRATNLPVPEREAKVTPTRRFRFDFLWSDPRPGMSLAVEVEGGTWVNGGHNRGKQIESDCQKSALAAMQGIRFMRVTAKQVESGEAIGWIERALA